MQFSTTPTLEGQTITEYCGVVTGEAILGANILLLKRNFARFTQLFFVRAGASTDNVTNPGKEIPE
jgi:uncharacterized protein YbjQ (UPF0145 family)